MIRYISFFLLFVFTLGTGTPIFVYAAQSEEAIQSDVEKIEEKIKKEEKDLQKSQGKASQAQSSLNTTRGQIKSTKDVINETKETISEKEKNIQTLKKQLEERQLLLAGVIRSLYDTSQAPFVGTVFSPEASTGFLVKDSTDDVYEEMKRLIAEVKSTREVVENEKEQLKKEKEVKESLLTLQRKEEQNKVGEVQSAQKDVAKSEAKIRDLQEELAELQKDLRIVSGKSYNAKDIKDAIKFASKKTGVPKNVLYGFLLAETNLGANTGQCTYKQVRKDAIDIWYGKSSKWERSRNLMEKRYEIFKGIVKENGYSKSKKVSCTPRSYRGQGGAMGVAQFMADTWRGYESDISSKTGHKDPDPWDITDGVMAMALKLKKAGATSDSKSKIRKASINYLGGFSQGYYNRIVSGSRNYKNL